MIDKERERERERFIAYGSIAKGRTQEKKGFLEDGASKPCLEGRDGPAEARERRVPRKALGY